MKSTNFLTKIIKNKKIEEIKTLSELLKLNNYEDKKIKIYCDYISNFNKSVVYIEILLKERNKTENILAIPEVSLYWINDILKKNELKINYSYVKSYIKRKRIFAQKKKLNFLKI